MRPIGLPHPSEQILQRAVVMVLEPVYEHSFLTVRIGFRQAVRRIKHCEKK